MICVGDAELGSGGTANTSPFGPGKITVGSSPGALNPVPVICTVSVAFAEVGEICATTGGPGINVTCMVADKVVSTVLFAVTETEPPPEMVRGAEYKPFDDMVPSVESPPTVPFTDQLTVLLKSPVPDTVAMNCCVLAVLIVGAVGEIATPVIWKLDEPIRTLALPDFVGSRVLVALTVTVLGFGGVADAV